MPTLLEDLEFLYGYVTAYVDRDQDCEANRAYARLRALIEANQPWLPPQQEGFGPWIEYRVGDPGPRIGDTVARLMRSERADRSYEHRPWDAATCSWDARVVAYCVKLPEAE